VGLCSFLSVIFSKGFSLDSVGLNGVPLTFGCGIVFGFWTGVVLIVGFFAISLAFEPRTAGLVLTTGMGLATGAGFTAFTGVGVFVATGLAATLDFELPVTGCAFFGAGLPFTPACVFEAVTFTTGLAALAGAGFAFARTLLLAGAGAFLGAGLAFPVVLARVAFAFTGVAFLAFATGLADFAAVFAFTGAFLTAFFGAAAFTGFVFLGAAFFDFLLC
jgi:hypothetical protein